MFKISVATHLFLASQFLPLHIKSTNIELYVEAKKLTMSIARICLGNFTALCYMCILLLNL